MSSASDRNGRPEDLANFAPKWARDPALKEKRDALRLASDQSGRGETDDDAPPVSPPAAHRDADVSDLRIARAAPQTLRRRADEGEMFTSEENVVTDPHRISRSLDPTIMQEPPRRPPTRGLFAFFAAAAGAEADGARRLPTLEAHPALLPMLQVQSFYRLAHAVALARGCDPDRPPHLPPGREQAR